MHIKTDIFVVEIDGKKYWFDLDYYEKRILLSILNRGGLTDLLPRY